MLASLLDDAEVKINIGRSVVGFDEISHFIKEDTVVLFPIRERPTGPWRSSLGQASFASRVTPDNGQRGVNCCKQAITRF
jgi:hypothetical protein